MKFELTALPFPRTALEPHMSRRTIEYHYEKHHRGYLTQLQSLLDERQSSMSLEQIMRSTSGTACNCAAQVWNHDFFWRSLTPEYTPPEGELRRLIEQSFGSEAGCAAAFRAAALDEFGSGWAWLGYQAKQDQLVTFSTTDAMNPLGTSITPLLTLDLWEHAYYLDHQNDRGKYVDLFLEHLVNWAFAAENLDTARSNRRAA